MDPEKIYPLLDWFVPQHLKAEHETLRRARIFLVSHFFGPFLGNTITLYLLWLDPHPGYALAVLTAAISTYWVFPLLLKATGALTELALVSVAQLIFTIFWGCYFYGGVSSPFFGWLVVVPLLAFLYLDSLKPRVTVLVMIGIGTGAFLFVVAWSGAIPEHVPLRALSGIGIVSIVTAAIYVSLMALYYAFIVASQAELEREVRSHWITADKLKAAKEEAESASLAKSNFLAGMSHELRTPLNAIIGYSEMLLEEPEIEEGEEQARQDLEKINASGKHLLAIISDVLDLSKIEAGKMELVNERIDLKQFVADLISAADPLCAKNRNELIAECADEMAEVEGDASKLRQIAMNLLSNAAKFTQNGRVLLKIEREIGPENSWMQISVQDTGIGIASEHLSALFEDFTQIGVLIHAKHGGTGLGLAITKRLSRLMGGDVTVESERGRGSCFTIRIPTPLRDVAKDRRVAKTAPVESLTSTPRGNIILVIDDDAAALDIVQRVLLKEGFTPVLLDNGRKALDLARKVKPKGIILDVRMPGVNGWDVLRGLKADSKVKEVPVVIVSVEDNRGEGLALGAADYVLKPIDRDTLLRVLDRVCPRSSNARPAMAEA